MSPLQILLVSDSWIWVNFEPCCILLWILQSYTLLWISQFCILLWILQSCILLCILQHCDWWVHDNINSTANTHLSSGVLAKYSLSINPSIRFLIMTGLGRKRAFNCSVTYNIKYKDSNQQCFQLRRATNSWL
jgi:hypothetical protein